MCSLDAPAFPKAVQLVESKWCFTRSVWEDVRSPVAGRSLVLCGCQGLHGVCETWAIFVPWTPAVLCWLVPLWQQSPLFLPALACVLGRAARQPSTGCPVPKWGCPPVLVALLPPAAVIHLCQPPQDGVCCVPISVLPLWWGSTGCWSVWKTRGLPSCCPPCQQ